MLLARAARDPSRPTGPLRGRRAAARLACCWRRAGVRGRRRRARARQPRCAAQLGLGGARRGPDRRARVRRSGARRARRASATRRPGGGARGLGRLPRRPEHARAGCSARTGAVVAAAASSLIRAGRARGPLRGLWRARHGRAPAPAARRARRGAGRRRRAADRRPAGRAPLRDHARRGLVAVYLGVDALLRMIHQPAADRTPLAPAGGDARRRRGRGRWSWPARRRRSSRPAALSEPAADAARPLQRPRRAVRPAVRRRRARRDPQLDVGAAPGLVLGRAGAADRRPARGRHPRAADRHPLRRPARQRARAHGLRQPRGAAGGDRRTA